MAIPGLPGGLIIHQGNPSITPKRAHYNGPNSNHEWISGFSMVSEPLFIGTLEVKSAALKWVWLKVKPGIGPQVENVHVSIHQGDPFWGYHFFDPQPNVRSCLNAASS